MLRHQTILQLLPMQTKPQLGHSFPTMAARQWVEMGPVAGVNTPAQTMWSIWMAGLLTILLIRPLASPGANASINLCRGFSQARQVAISSTFSSTWSERWHKPAYVLNHSVQTYRLMYVTSKTPLVTNFRIQVVNSWSDNGMRR